MAKRNGNMQRAGVPSGGTNAKKFLGWRSPVNRTAGEWQHKNPVIQTGHIPFRLSNVGFRKDGYKFILRRAS